MADQQNDPPQTKEIELDRGLFMVRYVSAEDQDFPPRMEISATSSSAEDVNIILHPDSEEPILWKPGTELVVQVVHQGRLVVRPVAGRGNGSTNALVQIHPLSQGHPTIDLATSPAQPPGGRALGAIPPLRLMGHVAERGDVFVEANDWIAGPTAPARIEGLALEWPSKPPGIDIRYAVTTAHGASFAATLAEPGTFIGTRGQALALVSLSLELDGPAASRHELVAEALFAGTSPIRAAGQKLELASPSGREPLAGLRICIQEVAPDRRAPATSTREPQGRKGGRVRVFRASDANRA